jgi:hypothetical protein
VVGAGECAANRKISSQAERYATLDGAGTPHQFGAANRKLPGSPQRGPENTVGQMSPVNSGEGDCPQPLTLIAGYAGRDWTADRAKASKKQICKKRENGTHKAKMGAPLLPSTSRFFNATAERRFCPNANKRGSDVVGLIRVEHAYAPLIQGCAAQKRNHFAGSPFFIGLSERLDADARQTSTRIRGEDA